jgi:hypothetical protein
MERCAKQMHDNIREYSKIKDGEALQKGSRQETNVGTSSFLCGYFTNDNVYLKNLCDWFSYVSTNCMVFILTGCQTLPIASWQRLNVVSHKVSTPHPAVPGFCLQNVWASHLHIWSPHVCTYNSQAHGPKGEIFFSAYSVTWWVLWSAVQDC